MKRKILIVCLLTLVMSLGLTTTVLADDPTTVEVTWNGGGIVDGGVVTGDTTTTFHSEGNSHFGEFVATDSNNNLYNYGVDTNTSALETSIAGSGWAELVVDRTDAKTSYGAAGQQSYTYVGVSNGAATLQNKSTSNYASMRDCNYGWISSNHITVTDADSYTLKRWMDSEYTVIGDANFAGIQATGTGDAVLNAMSSEASAGRVKLGTGCGCYTNASFNATGSGAVIVEGNGNTSATTAMAPGMVGASSFSFTAGWANSTISIPNYAVTAY